DLRPHARRARPCDRPCRAGRPPAAADRRHRPRPRHRRGRRPATVPAVFHNLRPRHRTGPLHRPRTVPGQPGVVGLRAAAGGWKLLQGAVVGGWGAEGRWDDVRPELIQDWSKRTSGTTCRSIPLPNALIRSIDAIIAATRMVQLKEAVLPRRYRGGVDTQPAEIGADLLIP